MSLKKCKLVLKSTTLYERSETIDDMDVPEKGFVIAKSVNTLEFGVPNDTLTRKQVDRILADHAVRIRQGTLSVEFVQ